MSSNNVTHIGVKIDTAPIKEFRKLVKSDKGGNLITDIAGAFMALEEIINKMTGGGLKNQVKYLEESTQIMIRSFEALAKVSVDTERIKQSKAQGGKRAARKRPTKRVLRDESDTIIALQGNLNTLKQLISYGEEHVQQIEKIDTFEQRTFAMKQAQAKLLKQQILDEDRLLEIQEQKEKAEKDLSKLKEGGLEYNQKKLEVLEADVRLRKEKHKLLRKEDVDTLDEAAKANYEMELKASRANILTSKELVKKQEKQIRNQQKITKETERTKKSVGKIIKDFFSMEKLIARISFVLTAKLSYQLFGAIARMPKDAIRLWREFSDEMHKVFALIPQTSAVMKMQMEDTILRLSKTYGIAAKEMSGALYEIITAQVPLANAMQVLEAATRLSIAGAADLRSATQSLVRIANAYGEGFDSITRISDIAFQTIKYGQLTMQDYTDEMQKVIATAAIFNISQEEISAAVATMTRNGVGASRAFTSLNQMLMQIANPTREAIKLMDQLGISLTIRDIQEKGLGGALQEIMPLLNTADQHGRQLINILFKTRTGFQAVASLLQNMDQYGENYMHMLDSAGTSTEAFEERSKNLGFAVDRMKTAWDNMLLSFARLGDSEFTGIVDKTTGMIEKLSEQSHALYTVFLMIGGLIAAFVATSALRAVASLATIRSTIQQLTTTMKVAGAEASAAWAKATMGLSLLIEAGIIAWRTFDKIRKDKAQKYWDDFWGVEQAKDDIEKFGLEIQKLDDRMSRLKGAEKMAKLWDSINRKQVKTNQEVKQMETLFGQVARVMDDLNIGIDAGGTNAERLGKYLIKIVEEMDKLERLTMRATMARKFGETQLSLSKWLTIDGIPDKEWMMLQSKSREQSIKIWQKEMDKHEPGSRKHEKAKKTLSHVRSQKDAYDSWMWFLNATTVSTRAIEGISQEVIPKIGRIMRSEDLDELEKLPDIIDEEIAKVSEMISVMDSAKKEVRGIDAPSTWGSEYKNLVKQAESNIEILHRLMTFLYSAQADGTRIKASDIDDWGGVEIGETAQKSFVDNLKSLLSPMLGTMIHLIPQTIKDEIQDKLNAIIKDIEEFEGEELDTAERQRIQGQLQEMLNTGVFAQVNTELVKSISELGEMAKSAYEMGNIDMAEEYMDRVVDVYWELENAIGRFSSNLDEIENTFRDPRELDAINRTLEEMSLGAFTQYVNALTGDRRIQAIRETLLEGKEFKDLEELIQEAERAGETGTEELLKAVYDSTLTNMLNTLSDMFPDDLPKYAEDIISIMQDKMNKGLIEDEAGLRSVMKEWVDGLSSEEQSAISEHLETIIDRIMGRKDDKLNWRNIFGIAEYETANDAVTDVAKKTVNTLTQVWDFYWDMELRKMQEQQDKKLKILEHEKDMMLANTNISNEQRTVLEQRYQEEQARLQEEFEKKSAKQKKKKAIFDATIDYAKGLISLWSASILTPIKAGVLSALLSGIFATQLAMINNQKFASGGFTGSGYGRPDETGHKPAGIVHAGELVFTKDMVNKNFAALSGLFGALKSGKSFDAYAMSHIAGNTPMLIKPSKSGSYASGGLVGNAGIANLNVNLSGLRVIDDVSLAKLVMRGNKKMRLING